LNDVVPQATDAGLQSDKQKAYEQEIFEQRMEENRNALLSLSDYWSGDSNSAMEDELPDYDYENSNAFRRATRRNNNPAVESYRDVQGTLNSFYDNYDDETEELRRQIDELKATGNNFGRPTGFDGKVIRNGSPLPAVKYGTSQ